MDGLGKIEGLPPRPMSWNHVESMKGCHTSIHSWHASHQSLNSIDFYLALMAVSRHAMVRSVYFICETCVPLRLLPLLAQLLKSQWQAAVQAVEEGKKTAIRYLLEDEEEFVSVTNHRKVLQTAYCFASILLEGYLCGNCRRRSPIWRNS